MAKALDCLSARRQESIANRREPANPAAFATLLGYGLCARLCADTCHKLRAAICKYPPPAKTPISVWRRARGGGFAEDADYGEDHLLVLRARRRDIQAGIGMHKP